MTTRVSRMGWATRAPCATCPYRRDVPVGTWHREEFETVVAADENEFGGAMFGCHATRKTEPQICAGWLLDQRGRRAPSIQLRLALIRDPAALEAFRAVSAGGADLYGSIGEMVSANTPGPQAGRTGLGDCLWRAARS